MPKLLETSFQQCAKNNQSVSLKSLKIRQIVTYDWESIIGADTDERGVFLNYSSLFVQLWNIFSVFNSLNLACEKVFFIFYQHAHDEMRSRQFGLYKWPKCSQMFCPGKKVVHLNCFRRASIFNLDWLSQDNSRETRHSSQVSLGWCHLIKKYDGNDDVT